MSPASAITYLLWSILFFMGAALAVAMPLEPVGAYLVGVIIGAAVVIGAIFSTRRK